MCYDEKRVVKGDMIPHIFLRMNGTCFFIKYLKIFIVLCIHFNYNRFSQHFIKMVFKHTAKFRNFKWTPQCLPSRSHHAYAHTPCITYLWTYPSLFSSQSIFDAFLIHYKHQSVPTPPDTSACTSLPYLFLMLSFDVTFTYNKTHICKICNPWVLTDPHMCNLDLFQDIDCFHHPKSPFPSDLSPQRRSLFYFSLP